MPTINGYTPKEILKYFFEGNKKLFKIAQLTKREVEIFNIFRNEILYDNGLKWASGGFSMITVYDIYEDFDNDGYEVTYLICEVKCGIQNDCSNSVDTWVGRFNRKTQKFENI